MHVADQVDEDLASILGVAPELFGPRAVAFRRSRAKAATALMFGVIAVGLAIPTALNHGLIDATGRPRPGSGDANLMVLQSAPGVRASPSAPTAPAATTDGGDLAAEVEPRAATAKPRQRLASATRRKRLPRPAEVDEAPTAALSAPAPPPGDEATRRVLAAERLEAVDAMRLLRQH